MSDLDEWRESFDDLQDGFGDDAWRGMSIARADADEPDCGFGSCRESATVVVEHADHGRRVVCETHVGANAAELFGVDPLVDGLEFGEQKVSSNSYTQSRLSSYQDRSAISGGESA